MKKLFALAMSLILLLSTAACGGVTGTEGLQSSEVSSVSAIATPKATQMPTAIPKATATPTPAPTATPTPTPEPTPTATPTPEPTPTPTPTPEPTPEPTPQPIRQENMVWIPTNGGTKYHRKSSCSGMKDPQEVSQSSAEAMGFTPCKKCCK